MFPSELGCIPARRPPSCPACWPAGPSARLLPARRRRALVRSAIFFFITQRVFVVFCRPAPWASLFFFFLPTEMIGKQGGHSGEQDEAEGLRPSSPRRPVCLVKSPMWRDLHWLIKYVYPVVLHTCKGVKSVTSEQNCSAHCLIVYWMPVVKSQIHITMSAAIHVP